MKNVLGEIINESAIKKLKKELVDKLILVNGGIYRIRKVNNLNLELNKHGIVRINLDVDMSGINLRYPSIVYKSGVHLIQNFDPEHQIVTEIEAINHHVDELLSKLFLDKTRKAVYYYYNGPVYEAKVLNLAETDLPKAAHQEVGEIGYDECRKEIISILGLYKYETKILS